MSLVLALTLAMVVLGLCVQMAILSLQVGALRRHREDSFRVLAFGSVCGVVYTCLESLPYVVTFSTKTWTMIHVAALTFLLPAYILGIAGTVLLFRSYRRLSEQVDEQTGKG